jgi:glycosyltransferase involved in cell wall biosynthesis
MTIDVLFLNWRDPSHPEGGGSEQYVQRIAAGLAGAGRRVQVFCAAHERAPSDEVVEGVEVVRRGGRLSVYPRGLAHVLRTRPRLVVDVQNGVPFLSPLVTRAPVVVLLHHVHREQWPIVFGRLGGALGWWLESQVAPRVYRRCRYVTVSRATADELVELGVDAGRISLAPNGVDPVPAVTATRSAEPRLVVLGRLVPHKQVEHAIDVVARLRDRWPALTLDVVGSGWWGEQLRRHADERGVADRVRFHGHVDEQTKHELLATSWLQLCPSVKEGWGIVVTEAGAHSVPTVAYRSAGGLRESVVDGETGLLVTDLDELTAAVDGLLADPARRAALGGAAAGYAAGFTWPRSVARFGAVLDAAAGGSAGAVVQDVGAAVGPHRAVRRGGREPLVGIEGRAGGGHAGQRDQRAGGDGGERGDERLHADDRFPRGRRRRGTVVALVKSHNPATPTSDPART